MNVCVCVSENLLCKLALTFHKNKLEMHCIDLFLLQVMKNSTDEIQKEKKKCEETKTNIYPYDTF